jgi:hypothetical protein
MSLDVRSETDASRRRWGVLTTCDVEGRSVSVSIVLTRAIEKKNTTERKQASERRVRSTWLWKGDADDEMQQAWTWDAAGKAVLKRRLGEGAASQGSRNLPKAHPERSGYLLANEGKE